MFINGAFLIEWVEHTADTFSVDQPVLEGEPAVGCPNIGICKNSQLHAPELGDIHHFLFGDPDVAAPPAAGAAAGGAGVLVEPKRILFFFHSLIIYLMIV